MQVYIRMRVRMCVHLFVSRGGGYICMHVLQCVHVCTCASLCVYVVMVVVEFEKWLLQGESCVHNSFRRVDTCLHITNILCMHSPMKFRFFLKHTCNRDVVKIHTYLLHNNGTYYHQCSFCEVTNHKAL